MSMQGKAPPTSPERQAKSINDQYLKGQPQQRPLRPRRGSEASTIHQLERCAGDHSIRPNLDLLNQEKQRQPSSTSPTRKQTGVPRVLHEQHDGHEVGADADKQRQERAQLGYLNALRELTAAAEGDGNQPSARASSRRLTERASQSRYIQEAHGGTVKQAGHAR